MEIWKDIPNYEGYYQVSNLGNVRSIDRVIKNRKAEYLLKGKDIKFSIDGGGYKKVKLSINGNKKDIKVHKLVAITFMNHKPNGFINVIDHIDGDKLNNELNNLQIISNRENTSKGYDNIETTSSYTGVSYEKQHKSWRARIYINGKNLSIGTYKNEKEASNAYNIALSNINLYNGNIEEFRESLGISVKKLSKFRGVSKKGNKWFSQIVINRNHIHLGYFDKEEEAYNVFLKAKQNKHLFTNKNEFINKIITI